MKVDTKNQEPSALRQDLLRGLRWGAILLIVMLLSIAGYRVLSSSPAVASPPAVADELTPTPSAAPVPDPVIQVGDSVLNGPDVPPAPKPEKSRKPLIKSTPVPIEQLEHLSAPAFAPSPAVAPNSTSKAFVASSLPDASLAPAVIDAPAASVIVPAVAPPPPDNSKQGNRATRAVRSVGRLFGVGRKDQQPKEDPAQK